MATTIGALRVELSANIAKFETAMGKAAKHMARTQRSFERFGTRASAAGRSLSIGLTAPLVAVGALSAKSFLSFEQGMNKVAAVSGATEAEMAELTAIAKDLGATTSFSAAQAAEGLGFLAQAGFDATEAGRALPGVLQLAAAGGIQLAEAADIATNVLAGYGLEVDQLARVNDVLAKASSSANTDVLQLGQAFKFAGPVASSAGVSFETSGAAMALMGNAGIQAEMAGTALRGAITKLVNPSAAASKTMAALGISATDSTGRLRPLDQIIEQLAPHADNTGAIMKIFGQRAGPAMSALISQGADALREMTTALEQSGGTAQEIADKKLAGLTGAWTKLKSATEGVLIEIGDRLSPVLERLAAILTDRILPAVRGALEAFDRLSPGMQTAAVAATAVTAALGPLLIVVGGVTAALTPLLPVLVALGKTKAVVAGLAAVKTVLAAVGITATMTWGAILGPISLVIAAIAAVYLAWKHWDVIEVIVGRVFSVVKTWLVDKFGGMVAFVKAALTRVIGFYVRLYGPIFTAVRKVYSAIKTWLVDYLMAAVEQIKGAVAAVVGFFRRAKQEADTRRMREEVQAAADRFTEIGKAAKAVEDRLRGFGKRIKLNPAAFREMSARAAEMRAEVDRLGTGAPASLKRLEAALDTTRKEMGLTAQSATDAGAAVEDLGESATGAGQPVGGLTDSVQTLVDRLRGTGAIQAAHNWAAAVDEAGGITMLTRGEQEELNRVLGTALEKYRALGQAVPPVVAALQNAARAVHEHTVLTVSAADAAQALQTAFGRQRPVLWSTSTDLNALGLTLWDVDRAAEAATAGADRLRQSFGGLTFLDTLTAQFEGFGAAIGQTFARALEGGGQWLGAIQSLGVQAGNRLGTSLSEGLGKRMTKGTGFLSKGLGAVLGKAAGMAIPLIGPVIGSLIGKLFSIGGPSEAELAGRKTAGAFRDGVIATLNDGQLAEASQAALGGAWRGNEQGAQFLIGVRDAYLAVGRSAAEAEAAVTRLWEAEKRGPEAVAAVQREIQGVLDLGEERARQAAAAAAAEQERAAAVAARHREVADGLAGIVDAGQAAFDPAQLDPYVAQMQELGLLTAEEAAALREMADEAHTDWQAMEAAARTYGVAMTTVVDEAGNETQVLDESLLGLGHTQAKLTDEAGRLAAAWDLLAGEGAHTGAAIRGMTDEAQGFVTQALEMGLALPAAMQPMIEKMIEQGRLTDQNGEKLTDISQLEFAAPLTSGFDLLADKIQMLIIALGGPSGLSKAVEEMVTSAGLQTTELAGAWAAMTTDMKAQFGSFEAFVEFRAMTARAGESFDTMQTRWAAMTEAQQQRYGTFEAYVRERVLRKMARDAGLAWKGMRTDWAAMTDAQQRRYGTFEAYVRNQVLRKMAREAGLKWKDMRDDWKGMTDDQQAQYGSFADFVQARLDAIAQRDEVTTSVGVTYVDPGFAVDDQTMTVHVRYDDPGFTPSRARVSAQQGTPFRDFGTGTPAVLHGLERVMTAPEGRGIAAALGRIQQGLGAIADLSGVRALAKGGWVTRPTLALLGEHEPEAVIPQSQIGRLGTSVQVQVDARGALFANEYTSQRELARIISDVIVSDLEGTRQLGLH